MQEDFGGQGMFSRSRLGRERKGSRVLREWSWESRAHRWEGELDKDGESCHREKRCTTPPQAWVPFSPILSQKDLLWWRPHPQSGLGAFLCCHSSLSYFFPLPQQHQDHNLFTCHLSSSTVWASWHKGPFLMLLQSSMPCMVNIWECWWNIWMCGRCMHECYGFRWDSVMSRILPRTGRH